MTHQTKKFSLSFFVAGLLALWVLPVHAEEGVQNLSLRNEVDHAIHQTLTQLAQEQTLDGYWSSTDFPAITAIIVRSFLESPVDSERWQKSDTVAKGIAFLKSYVQEDGGIYNRGLYSYNSAISLMCLNVYYPIAEEHELLSEAELAELKETMIRAREFVVSQQQFYTEDDLKVLSGGIGYGRSSHQADLSNTMLAIQALHETRHLVDGDDETVARLDWEAAIQFLTSTQNLPETNQEEWVSGDPANRGGFIYRPGDSFAGSFEKESGGTGFRSYGSMTYAGLMSMIYAGLDRDDERVVAAVEWLKGNFNLEDNVGLGEEGLYYYYAVMARALDAYGEDKLVLEDGTEVDWRYELARKLISHHRYPGFWINENSRWMESNPLLVTAYSLQALNNIYTGL